MLRINTNTGDYEFFDDSRPYPPNDALIAAGEKLEIVHHENDHLSNLLPGSENGFNAFGPVLTAYLGQQVLMITQCTIEANKYVIELNGRDAPLIPGESFHVLYTMGILPREIARPMRRSLKRFRDQIAHPSRAQGVPEFYPRAVRLVDTVRDYVDHVKSHLQTQSVLLAHEAREDEGHVEAHLEV